MADQPTESCSDNDCLSVDQADGQNIKDVHSSTVVQQGMVENAEACCCDGQSKTSADQQPLHSMFQIAADTFPDNIAVVFDDGTRIATDTYRELSQKADKVSDCLRSVILPNETVAIFLQQTRTLIPAVIIGILQVPASFYYIDVSAQMFLVEAIISFSLRWVIVSRDLKKAIISMLHDSTLIETRPCDWLCGYGLELLHLVNIPIMKNRQRCAYCITTSGTTGKPKTVRVPHSAIVPNIIHLRKIFSVVPSDQILLTAPLTFDPSMIDLFMTLTSGASLLIIPDLFKIVPEKLISMTTVRHAVSILQATPSLIRRVQPELLGTSLFSGSSNLRLLALGGEQCPDIQELKSWRHPENSTRIVNLYGTTEVSCWATYYEVTDEDFSKPTMQIPLGVPLLETVVEVRDEDNTVIKSGQGQLHIGSSTRICLINDETLEVAYSNRYRPTGDIVQYDGRGRLYYVGRMDSQIKRHGKRLSLTTIEQAAVTVRDVQHAIALVNEEQQLFVFIQTDSQHEVNQTVCQLVRRHISTKLPSQYLVDDVIQVNLWPITKHGKVDKRALLQIAARHSQKSLYSHRPDITLESVTTHLTSLWMELLPINYAGTIPCDLSMIQCGGNSFTVVRAMNAIQEMFHINSPLLLDTLLTKPFSTVCEHILDDLEGKGGWEHMVDSNEMRTGTTDREENELVMTRKKLSDDHVMDQITSQPSLPSSLLETVSSSSSSSSSAAVAAGTAQGQAANLTSMFLVTKPVANFNTQSRELLNKANEQHNVSETPHQKVNNSSCSVIKAQKRKHQCVEDPCKRNIDHIKCKSDDMHYGQTLDTSISHTEVENQSDNITHALTMKDFSGANICSECYKKQCLPYSTTQSVVGQVRSSSSYRLSCRRGGQLYLHGHIDNHQVINQSEYTSTMDGTGSCCYSQLCIRDSCFRCSAVRSNSRHERAYCARSMLNRKDHKLVLREMWKYNTGKCVDASPLLTIDRAGSATIFIGSHSHKLCAISMTTRKALWEITLANRIESSACLSHCGQWIIVGCYDGSIYCVDASSGSVHWKYETGAEIKSSPVVDPHSSLVIVGSHDQHLYALNVEKRCVCWKVNLGGGSVFSSPCVSCHPYCVYAATLAGRLVALQPLTGEELWSFTCQKPIFASPVCGGDRVVFAAVDGLVYCLSTEGELVWTFQTGAPVFSSPVISAVMHCLYKLSHNNHSEMVLVGSHDKSLYCLEAKTGHLKWKFDSDSEVYSTPFVINGFKDIFSNRETSQCTCVNISQVAANLPYQDFKCMRKDDISSSGDNDQRYSDSSPDDKNEFHFANSDCCSDSRVGLKCEEINKFHCKYCSLNQHDKGHNCDSQFLIDKMKCGNDDKLSDNSDSIISARHMVLFCSTSGTLYVLDQKSGALITMYTLPGHLFSSPVIYQDRIVIGCRDDYVYCLELYIRS